MTKKTHKTREEWLMAGAKLLEKHIEEHQQPKPTSYQCSASLPSKSALSAHKRRVGEAWSPKACNGVSQVFISPTLQDPIDILGTLLHELVHVAVGVEHGHRSPFAVCARAVGLEGKMTSTKVSEDLRPTLETIANNLGPYPQRQFDPRLSGKKVQSTRLLKVECPGCGYIARITQKWIDVGCPVCPCGEEMQAV